jgi:hypothetical protein
MKRIKEKLALANMVMSIGILLTIVPLVVALINFASASPNDPLGVRVMLGWIYVMIVYGLLPVGMFFFIVGLTSMFILRKKLKSAPDDEDEEE